MLELTQGCRLGYASGFLDRQVLLKVLYDRLPDKSKLKVGKRMTSIEHTDTGVIVQCEDSSRYIGDIVVGADGIHSKTKREMWRRFDMLGRSQLITEDKTGEFR